MKAWQKNIRKVEPYVAGYQPKDYNVIKLNANENPYPPSPKVEKAAEEFKMGNLRLYPDLTSKELVDALADFRGVKPEQVFVGVGSDDVIAMSFLTFFNSDKPILFPDITYSFYDVWADLYRIPYERPAVDENFKINPKDYYKENGGVIIANPNAPTSISEGEDFLRDILDHNRDVIVIVDEAYVDFGGTSAIDLINEYDNLLVVQTFSKSRSMAGIRIGYAIGNEELITALNNVKNSYNSYTMNMLTLRLGAEAVADNDYFEETLSKVIKTREWFCEEMEKIGFHSPKSATNFIFCTHERVPAKEIFTKLQEQNLYVRFFNKPRIDNHLRITIGTDEQMQILLDAIKKIVC